MHLKNYPNPFNPRTTIHYSIPVSGKVVLAIYDVLGREVDRLVDMNKRSGEYSILYDAGHLASGIYLYRLSTSEQTILKKMVLLK